MVFLILLEACVSGADGGSFVSGDGVLDCLDGQVVRSVEIDVSTDGELAVVAAALAQWTDEGGSLLELPSDESWSVVLDGRDVAIAYPEIDGTGSWVVHDVRTCGEPMTGPAAIDGEPDCANESRWSIQATLEPTIPGLPSADEALRSALEPYAQRHGGEIVLIQDEIGSLVVQQREQVIALASEVPAGGWAVATLAGCDGFDWHPASALAVRADQQILDTNE